LRYLGGVLLYLLLNTGQGGCSDFSPSAKVPLTTFDNISPSIIISSAFFHGSTGSPQLIIFQLRLKRKKQPNSNFMNDIMLQRAYYARTASVYDEAHLSASEPEHDFALDVLSGIARAQGYNSFLDIGSGTGRGIARLQKDFPEAEILGVEPVAELRAVGHRKGIQSSCLVDGDVTNLSFNDGSFDCVLALGVMHHLANPRRAISQMARVSRKAIFISDLNNLGCGSIYQRLLSHLINTVGLWRAFQFIKNGFKSWKFNEGDGIHYSYSLLNEMTFLRSLGLTPFLFTTRPTGRSPSWTCSHLAVFGMK
jgi:ubiquinone/menaquinone biosynthesis C-methylase UbiE